MATDPASDPQIIPPTPKAEPMIRAFVHDRTKDADVSSIPALVEETLTWLVQRPEIYAEYLRSSLRVLVYSVVQAQIATTRKDLILLGEEALTRPALLARGEILARKWGQWSERSDTLHVRVRAMRRADCYVAAARRYEAAERDLSLGHLFKQLGDALTDEQTVGDVFSDEQIEQQLQIIQSQPMTLSTSDRSWAARLLGRRASLPQDGQGN